MPGNEPASGTPPTFSRFLLNSLLLFCSKSKRSPGPSPLCPFLPWIITKCRPLGGHRMVLSCQVVQGGPATSALLPQGGSGLNKRELKELQRFKPFSKERSELPAPDSLTLAAGTCSRWTHTCLKVCSGDRVSMPVTNGLENRVSPISANSWGLKNSTWSWKIPQGVSSDCPRMSIGPLTLTAPSIPTLPHLIHHLPAFLLNQAPTSLRPALANPAKEGASGEHTSAADPG